jgi:hypothetical protein
MLAMTTELERQIEAMFAYELTGNARHQTPEAASGDHPGGDHADVARHDEVTE